MSVVSGKAEGGGVGRGWTRDYDSECRGSSSGEAKRNPVWRTEGGYEEVGSMWKGRGAVGSAEEGRGGVCGRGKRWGLWRGKREAS